MAIQKGHRVGAMLPSSCMAAAAVVLAGVAFSAAAAETSHGAHEHGAAEIELAVEGSDVVVNFTSPMYNLVGFEHAPRDEQDHEAVAAARVLLDDPGNLVRLEADAKCTAVELDIDWDVPSAGEDDDARDADEADHHDEHDAGEQHADVTVTVRYTCDHPDRLNSLNITAFESFGRLSEVELRAVGPGGAVAEHLERGSARADLRGLFGR